MATPAQRWSQRRTFHHSQLPAELVAAQRERSVSVLLPARDEAATIGPIVAALLPLLDCGVIDQVAVLDDSTDGTGDVARALGAEVYDQSSLMARFGPVQGKGDAMWRGLSVATGEVVCYLDADSDGLGPHFAAALAGLVALPGDVHFAKAFYRRPFKRDGAADPTGGGRVTELCARPLLSRFYPELAEVRQPLAGEIAVRRDLLERLAFPCGYAVDVALLIDAWRAVGLDGLAQVDLDVRQNRHRPLEELGPMAYAVLSAVTDRLRADGRLHEAGDEAALGPAGGGPAPWLERPPLASLRALS